MTDETAKIQWNKYPEVTKAMAELVVALEKSGYEVTVTTNKFIEGGDMHWIDRQKRWPAPEPKAEPFDIGRMIAEAQKHGQAASSSHN